MENIIKGLFRLDPFLENISETEKQQIIDKLELGAKLHARHSRIDFKIGTETLFPHLLIEVRQGKNPNGNYASDKELIEVAKELFKVIKPYVVAMPIRPIVFHQAPTEIVDSKWILDNMQSNKVSLKQLCLDTGVDKTTMSAYVNGLKPLSQTVKSMFYYYFKSLLNNC